MTGFDDISGTLGDDDPSRAPDGLGSPASDAAEPPAEVDHEALAQTLFPSDFHVEVEELVDDVVPDLERASLVAVDAALVHVADAVEHCASTKRLVSVLLSDDVLRTTLERIRTEKSAIFRIRATLESRRTALVSEQEAAAAEAARRDRAWSEAERAGVTRPTGFAAWTTTPDDARKAAESAKASLERQRKANDDILRMRRETQAKAKAARERQHEAFQRLIQGRRY